MILIALAGYSRSGKDEVGKILVDRYNFTRVAKGDLIEQAAYAIDPLIGEQLTMRELVDEVGWEKAKDLFPRVRTFLQRLPDEVLNVCGIDAFNEAVFTQIERQGLQTVVLTRICLPTEAEAVKLHGGEVWWVHRPGVGPVDDSPNENALNDWEWDVRINNEGTLEDLADEIARAMPAFV